MQGVHAKKGPKMKREKQIKGKVGGVKRRKNRSELEVWICLKRKKKGK